MDFEVKKLINDLTTDIIKVYNIEIPISNIDAVVYAIGGRIEIDTSLSMFSDAFLKKYENSFKIILPQDLKEPQKNFLVACELGHLFLHMGYQIDKELWDSQKEYTHFRSTEKQKRQAIAFGEALLMPKYEYKSIMDNHTKENVVNVNPIAKHFKVSDNIAAERGFFLGHLSGCCN